jgi:hypothetical protein
VAGGDGLETTFHHTAAASLSVPCGIPIDKAGQPRRGSRVAREIASVLHDIADPHIYAVVIDVNVPLRLRVASGSASNPIRHVLLIIDTVAERALLQPLPAPVSAERAAAAVAEWMRRAVVAHAARAAVTPSVDIVATRAFDNAEMLRVLRERYGIAGRLGDFTPGDAEPDLVQDMRRDMMEVLWGQADSDWTAVLRHVLAPDAPHALRGGSSGQSRAGLAEPTQQSSQGADGTRTTVGSRDVIERDGDGDVDMERDSNRQREVVSGVPSPPTRMQTQALEAKDASMPWPPCSSFTTLLLDN